MRIRSTATRLSMLCTLCIALATVTASAFAQGLPHTFSAGAPALAGEVNANFRYVAPPNVVHVNVVGDGSDAVANGAELLAAVDPANLTAINGAPASGNPYVVRVSPGVYDLNGASLAMLPYVDVVGAGQRTTQIISAVSGVSGGVVNGATDSTLQGVRVYNSGTGGTHVGIFHTDSAGEGLRVIDASILMAGSGNQLGIYASGSNVALYVRDVRVFQVGASSYSTGIDLENSATGVLENVTVEVTANVAVNTSGIGVYTGSTLTARNIEVTVSNGDTSGSASRGITISGSTGSVANATITMTDGDASDRYPVSIGNSTLHIDQSRLLNGNNTASDYFASVGTNGTLRIGASKLSTYSYGVPSGSTGHSVVCAQSYEASYSEITTCSSALI